MSVTLMLIPDAISVRIAGMPAGVAGTLIIRFGRPTAAWSRFASATVPAVSCASFGDTSSEMNPSRPPDASNTPRSTSAPRRMSSTAIAS